MKRHRRNRLAETVELNITAFLNLMVVLVPFLLITAVFSRMTVLELNLPALAALEQSEEPVSLELQVLYYPDVLLVRDANLGTLREFPVAGEPPWAQFSEFMLALKQRFPDEEGITLLMDAGVDYQTLITLMDRVRSGQYVNVAELQEVSLFPNIGIGTAPERAEAEDGN